MCVCMCVCVCACSAQLMLDVVFIKKFSRINNITAKHASMIAHSS